LFAAKNEKKRLKRFHRRDFAACAMFDAKPPGIGAAASVIQ
jgi:hypothetical protein